MKLTKLHFQFLQCSAILVNHWKKPAADITVVLIQLCQSRQTTCRVTFVGIMTNILTIARPLTTSVTSKAAKSTAAEKRHVNLTSLCQTSCCQTRRERGETTRRQQRRTSNAAGSYEIRSPRNRTSRVYLRSMTLRLSSRLSTVWQLNLLLLS